MIEYCALLAQCSFFFQIHTMVELDRILLELSQVNEKLGLKNDLLRSVDQIHQGIDKRIYVAVLGQFKAGKSSLINHVLGVNLLPIDVVPVTAIVTQIRYNPFPSAIVQYFNGKGHTVAPDEIVRYVTEQENPENIKKVAQVIIEHPAMEKLRNITLVDTPGLGSFYRHNSTVTLEWLPYTGVALIAVSAERPLSEEDMELARNVTHYCPEVALVITKTDLFDEEEQERIRQYITDSVEKAFQRSIKVFEYSVKEKAEEYRNLLKERLLLRLNENASEKIHSIIRYKTAQAIRQSIQLAHLQLEASKKKKSEQNAVSQLINEIKENRHFQEREMMLTTTSYKGEVRAKLEGLLLPYLPGISEWTKRQFASEFREWKGSLFRISRQYEAWLRDKLGQKISELDKTCSEDIFRFVRKMADYFQYAAQQFRQKMDDKVFQAFGTHLPEVHWQVDFTTLDHPDVSIYRAFDSHLDMLLFFLPIQWFRKYFFRHFSRQIALEAEKNLHRYISDMTGKIILSLDQMQKQALFFIQNEVRAVEAILENAPDDFGEISKNIERLKALAPLV